MLQEFFNGKKPNKSINPDEFVAYGAVAHDRINAYGFILGNNDQQIIMNPTLEDVLYLTYHLSFPFNFRSEDVLL